MAFCRLIFPILVLSVIQSCSSTQVPVFLWGDLDNISLKSNPLTKIPVGEFDAILKDELREDPFTVIFIEETLSVEDFSLKNSDGESSYPYLHANIGNSVYLPSVENALHVLNRLADPDKVDHVKLTENGLSAEIEPEGGKLLFINLKDARVGESRADLLRRHDNFIRKTFTELQGRYNKLVAVYTAHYPSWTIPEAHSRVRRQAAGSTEINVALPNLLLYAGSLKLQTDRGTVQLSNPTSNSVFRNETQLNQTLVFDNETLRLNFISSHGYWLFNTVTLNPSEDNEGNDLQATSEVYAVHGFSYRCAQQVVFAAVNTTHKNKLTFDDLKIQPFFETRNNSDTTFGDSFNCVGFFSVAIWSGLFVVFILLSITFYGIMMMMDIRTMDRFDDPKGKTITINASE